MVSGALVAKIAIPTAVAVSGIVAAIALPSTPSSVDVVAGSAVWIDAPADGLVIEPRIQRVQAHATSDTRLDSLELLVDGESVASDTDLERDGSFVYAEFDWDATSGTHDLTVRGASGISSTTHTITVSRNTTGTAPEDQPADSTTTSEVPDTSTSADPTSTTAPPATTTTTTSKPTTTTAPTVPSPTVGAVSVSGDCTLTVAAPVTNVVSASVRITGPHIGFDTSKQMTVAAGQARTTVDIYNADVFTIIVTGRAANGATSTSQTTFENACKP